MSLKATTKENESRHPNADSPRLMVSIIIVSWNAQDYLRQCLESLFAEECRYPMEVIVVDNASSDGSAESVARDYPQVRLIRNVTNLGFARANNIGISAATGKYLCLINSDVKMLPDCINRLVEYQEEHPDVGMVGPRVIGGDGKLQRSCRGFPTVWNMFCRALALDTIFPGTRAFTGYSLRYWPQDTCRAVDILSGCFWLVRCQALGEVGLLDESFFMYGEDIDWCKRFWKRGWKLAFVPSAEAIHYGGASSANSPVRFYIERHRADLQYWQKHHSGPGIWTYFLLTCLHLFLRLAGYFMAFLLRPSERKTYQYKVKRSLAALKWMLSVGIRQRKGSLAPTLSAVANPAEVPVAN
jgi:GT2 family glycosyltransferase